MTKITKRCALFHRLRGEVNARHFSGAEILRPLPELSDIRIGVAAGMAVHRRSEAVTFSRSSISSFYAARYAARGAHRASPAKKYLLDRRRVEFVRA